MPRPRVTNHSRPTSKGTRNQQTTTNSTDFTTDSQSDQTRPTSKDSTVLSAAQNLPLSFDSNNIEPPVGSSTPSKPQNETNSIVINSTKSIAANRLLPSDLLDNSNGSSQSKSNQFFPTQEGAKSTPSKLVVKSSSSTVLSVNETPEPSQTNSTTSSVIVPASPPIFDKNVLIESSTPAHPTNSDSSLVIVSGDEGDFQVLKTDHRNVPTPDSEQSVQELSPAQALSQTPSPPELYPDSDNDHFFSDENDNTVIHHKKPSENQETHTKKPISKFFSKSPVATEEEEEDPFGFFEAEKKIATLKKLKSPSPIPVASTSRGSRPRPFGGKSSRPVATAAKSTKVKKKSSKKSRRTKKIDDVAVYSLLSPINLTSSSSDEEARDTPTPKPEQPGSDYNDENGDNDDSRETINAKSIKDVDEEENDFADKPRLPESNILGNDSESDLTELEDDEGESSGPEFDLPSSSDLQEKHTKVELDKVLKELPTRRTKPLTRNELKRKYEIRKARIQNPDISTSSITPSTETSEEEESDSSDEDQSTKKPSNRLRKKKIKKYKYPSSDLSDSVEPENKKGKKSKSRKQKKNNQRQLDNSEESNDEHLDEKQKRIAELRAKFAAIDNWNLKVDIVDPNEYTQSTTTPDQLSSSTASHVSLSSSIASSPQRDNNDGNEITIQSDSELSLNSISNSEEENTITDTAEKETFSARKKTRSTHNKQQQKSKNVATSTKRSSKSTKLRNESSKQRTITSNDDDNNNDNKKTAKKVDTNTTNKPPPRRRSLRKKSQTQT